MATILLIADEGPLSDRYRGWLADAHTVRVASTGERALATLDDEVDAALLERRLPDGTGRAVLERLRREGYRCRVALLADVEPEFDVVRAGFDECLERPVTRAVLSATIDRLCRRRRYDERVREYHTLVRERTALEKRLSDETLAASAEYEELQHEIETVETALDDLLATFDRQDTVALFANLSTPMYRPDDETRRTHGVAK
ncbi:HalX domain-containing protein [Halospeciosus flavus]|uniref:HalX domain-containing protein n=1 Tax=Halospeciosus flavus TaxID=3032283 RepID=A0ABD5Z625_9EURY|nr:HalX domain-containing protein [Halospeciosus flavus]